MFQNLQIDNDLPKVEELNFRPVEKAYRTILYLNLAIFFFIGSLGIGVFAWLGGSAVPEFILPVLVPLWLLINMSRAYFIFRNFKTRQIALREKDITYKQGWLNHNITTIPFVRIQHVEIEEGVLERFFKLASIQIYTAGENGSDLNIKGLSKEDALIYKDLIINKVKEEND